MSLPRKIRIGPWVYDVTAKKEMVKWAEKREGKIKLDGYISFRHKRIVINTRDYSKSNCQFSLAHEVVHGILDVMGDNHVWEQKFGGAYEEGFVDRFAHAWIDVMRENPTLVRYLTEEG